MLNRNKCEFAKSQLSFLSHTIDQEGIHADPAKTTAIFNMNPPTSVPELRRFMGMINQLGKFTPNLAELTQPLWKLLSKISQWLWGPAQSSAFDGIKTELSKPTSLAHYDPDAPTKYQLMLHPTGSVPSCSRCRSRSGDQPPMPPDP